MPIHFIHRVGHETEPMSLPAKLICAAAILAGTYFALLYWMTRLIDH